MIVLDACQKLKAEIDLEVLAEIEKRHPEIFWEITHEVTDRKQVEILRAEIELVKTRGGVRK